jgi:hypothetical protein
MPSVLTSTVHSVSLVFDPHANHDKCSITAGRDQTTVVRLCCMQIKLSMQYVRQTLFIHISSLSVLLFYICVSHVEWKLGERHQAVMKGVWGLICN